MLTEIEELNRKLNTIQNSERDREQLFKSKQSKLVSDIEDLRSQLEKTREREKMKVSCLEGEKVQCTRNVISESHKSLFCTVALIAPTDHLRIYN